MAVWRDWSSPENPDPPRQPPTKAAESRRPAATPSLSPKPRASQDGRLSGNNAIPALPSASRQPGVLTPQARNPWLLGRPSEPVSGGWPSHPLKRLGDAASGERAVDPEGRPVERPARQDVTLRPRVAYLAASL